MNWQVEIVAEVSCFGFSNFGSKADHLTYAEHILE